MSAASHQKRPTTTKYPDVAKDADSCTASGDAVALGLFSCDSSAEASTEQTTGDNCIGDFRNPGSSNEIDDTENISERNAAWENPMQRYDPEHVGESVETGTNTEQGETGVDYTAHGDTSLETLEQDSELDSSNSDGGEHGLSELTTEELYGAITDSSSSPSPRKGEYIVCRDRLSPFIIYGNDSDKSKDTEMSDVDSDNSDSQYLSGKCGSYDVVRASSDDDDDDDYVNDREDDDSGNGNEANSMQDDSINAHNKEPDEKGHDKGNMEDDGSDEDEFFDAVAGLEESEEPVESAEVVLPDPSVASDESYEPEGDPPPPPSTPLPVLQAIDIFAKYSLSQGWIERVNKSLVESSMSKGSPEEARSWEAETGREAGRGDFLKRFVGVSSAGRKGHALLDQLKKSASDNRHDHSPRPSSAPARRTTPGTPGSANDKQSSFSEPASPDKENPSLPALSGASPGPETDDTAPPAISKLRRSTYVSAGASRYNGAAKPGGVGYRLPTTPRARTDSYLKAVSQNRSPSSGEDRKSTGGDSREQILSLSKTKSPGALSSVRSSARGVLLPTWSSLPVFSSSDDTDPTGLVTSGDPKVSSASLASDTSGNESAYFSALGDSLPSLPVYPCEAPISSPKDAVTADNPHRHLSNRNLPLVLQTNYQSSLQDPDTVNVSRDLGSTKSGSRRNRKRDSQNVNVDEGFERSYHSDDNSSRPASRTQSWLTPSGHSTTDNSGAAQDTLSDTVQRKRKKRVDYELLPDAENDVMRVKYTEPHGLTRKPAVRRKGRAYHSKVSALCMHLSLCVLW